ncbi:MAG: PIG-L family deacetylase [Acidimicrobiia bacterium]|nr:PIG-L family deacetylase [Acidimicrobiia bacterium]
MPPGAPPNTTVVVPDGRPLDQVLVDATDVAVVAHPDDLELLLGTVVATCAADAERSLVGIVCTDGAGSVGVDGAPTGSQELAALRATEQRAAAELGGHTVLMLGHSSATMLDPARRSAVVDDLVAVMGSCRPATVHTHALVDRHATHVAVALLTIDTVRALPSTTPPPTSLLGIEGWSSLDWLADSDLVELPGRNDDLTIRMARCFTSQLTHKRYDLAMQGRWRANATFRHHDAPDDVAELALALDMTPLLADPDLAPAEFLGTVTARARRTVAEQVSTLTHHHT